jgi:flavin-dependent dehydrogenase
LARAGLEVVLIDRLSDLRSAAFSSAALPLAAVRRFRLPQQLVAARWSGWQLVGPDDHQRRWRAAEPQGAVLDFGALRQWLADEAIAAGVRLLLGWQARSCQNSCQTSCHKSGASTVETSLLGPGGQRQCLGGGCQRRESQPAG